MGNDDRIFDDKFVNTKERSNHDKVEVPPRASDAKRSNDLIIQMDSNSFFNASSIKN
jgi:hypothetical protein